MAKILVVDDDRATRHLLTKLLTRAGFAATAARDGRDALTRLQNDRYDLMLLDIWMPRMTGLDLLAALRKKRRRIKVVVMTSDDTPETLLQTLREQAFEYVNKPVDPAALLRIVRDV